MRRPRPRQPLPEIWQADLVNAASGMGELEVPATDGTTQTLREAIRRASPDDVEPHMERTHCGRSGSPESKDSIEYVGGAAPDLHRPPAVTPLEGADRHFMPKETMTQFRCTINDCGERFLRMQKLSYYLHLKEEHSVTYKQNQEYIDAKITVLKYEDPEFEDLSTNGLAL